MYLLVDYRCHLLDEKNMLFAQQLFEVFKPVHCAIEVDLVY